MPTFYKAQLAESATPMLEIWERMYEGLRARAPAILAEIGYYAQRDFEPPGPEWNGTLTEDEQEELGQIVRALMDAAIMHEAMPERILLATLERVAKNPSQFFSNELPAAVQWELATDYQRGDEMPGTFA